MTDLKSLIPDDPTGLLRTRYKYIHPKTSVYILAFFTQRVDGTSVAEWPMYQDETIIIEEQISPTSDFHKMIDSWEEQYHEDVVCK